MLAGRIISIVLFGGASSVNVRLEGEMKGTVQTIRRDVRAVIEFGRLSEMEQATAAVLSVMSDVLVNNKGNDGGPGGVPVGSGSADVGDGARYRDMVSTRRDPGD